MSDKKLTIDQANQIGDGLVTVSVDPIDAELWQVEGDGFLEAHEPMGEAAWRRLLRSHTGTSGRPDKIYDVPVGGRKRRVTVPEDPKPEDVLVDVLRENLSPQAIAGIVAYLQPARTNDPEANRQIDWFRQKLVETVGGVHELNRLCEEIGL